MDVFIISSLPLRVDEEIPSAGSLGSTSVTRLLGYYGPIRHPHASVPLPGVAGYRNALPPGISPRGVEGFSSCFTRPCHRATAVYPAGVDSRLSQSASVHAAFAITQKARPPDLVHFGATLRSRLLRPGDSLTALKAALSMSFKCLVSRTPVIQATGIWLLPRQALLSC